MDEGPSTRTAGGCPEWPCRVAPFTQETAILLRPSIQHWVQYINPEIILNSFTVFTVYFCTFRQRLSHWSIKSRSAQNSRSADRLWRSWSLLKVTLHSSLRSWLEMRVLFREMKNSTRAPDAWQGGLNTPYRLGPGMQNVGWKVKLEVHTSNKMATIHNTIGIIRGEEEPGNFH